jgi:hypothetical protein
VRKPLNFKKRINSDGFVLIGFGSAAFAVDLALAQAALPARPAQPAFPALTPHQDPAPHL